MNKLIVSLTLLGTTALFAATGGAGPGAIARDAQVGGPAAGRDS
jgi:hypothetical protein